MSADILLVTGVSGSGKDHLLDGAKKFEPRLGFEIPLLNMGSMIVKKLSEQSDLESSFERDALKDEFSNTYMRQIVKEIILGVAQHDAAVINGHITYRQQGQLVANPDIDAAIQPIGYAVIVAEPKDIAEWRSLDTTRKRGTETLDEIASHQEFTVQTAEKMASDLGVDVTVLENSNTNDIRSSLELARMVSNICPR